MNVCIFTIIIRIVSKITISSPFVSIRIVSCDDRIVSSLMLIYNVKTQVEFDLGYNPLIFDRVMGLL